MRGAFGRQGYSVQNVLLAMLVVRSLIFQYAAGLSQRKEPPAMLMPSCNWCGPSSVSDAWHRKNSVCFGCKATDAVADLYGAHQLLSQIRVLCCLPPGSRRIPLPRVTATYWRPYFKPKVRLESNGKVANRNSSASIRNRNLIFSAAPASSMG